MMRRVAATLVLGFLLHVVFSNIGSDFDLAVVYWLLYALACGMLINYEGHERHLELLLLSIPSPAVVVGVTYYRALFRGIDTCWLSGIQCTLDVEFVVKSGVFFAASVLFIWLFSYLSVWAMALIVQIFTLSPARAKTIRTRIVWIGSVVVAIVGVVQILAHGWRLR